MLHVSMQSKYLIDILKVKLTLMLKTTIRYHYNGHFHFHISEVNVTLWINQLTAISFREFLEIHGSL